MQYCMTHGSDSGVFPFRNYQISVSHLNQPPSEYITSPCMLIFTQVVLKPQKKNNNLYNSATMLPPQHNAYKLFEQCNRKTDQPFDLTDLILKVASWQAMALQRGRLKNIHTNKDAIGFNVQQYIHYLCEDLETWLSVNYHAKFFQNSCSGL